MTISIGFAYFIEIFPVLSLWTQKMTFPNNKNWIKVGDIKDFLQMKHTILPTSSIKIPIVL